MQRLWLKIMAASLVCAALVAVMLARAADSPSPQWKLIDVSAGHEVALVLFKIEEKGGKPQVNVLAAPLLGEDVKIENPIIDAKSMQFDLKYSGTTLHVKGFAPKSDAKSKAVLGSIDFNGRILLAQFNKTDDKELSEEEAKSKTAEGEQFDEARGAGNAKERQKALLEIIDKWPDKPVAYPASQLLLQNYVEGEAKDEQLRDAAAKLTKIGANFGPDVEKNTIANICQILGRAKKPSPFAVEFAVQAEKSLKPDDPPSRSLIVLKSVAGVLRRTGKIEEAKKLDDPIEKFEQQLDADFEKTAAPFKPEEPKSRKGGSARVSMVELFTGAYCPPCVAADVAFDAAMQTYKPKDVVFLQYHLHIPASDRLTNTDSMKRGEYYKVEGVPMALLNGKPVAGLGGPKNNGKKSYEKLADSLDSALETEAGGFLSLNVERKGEQLELDAEVTQLKKPGEKVKLRFVLVEEVVRYPGGNGQRLHHHVVRDMPGGAAGFVLPDTRAHQKVTVNLDAVRKSLDEYMTKFNEGPEPFLDDEHPLSLKKLKVVAFIQNDDNKEILQAVQADVPETK